MWGKGMKPQSQHPETDLTMPIELKSFDIMIMLLLVVFFFSMSLGQSMVCVMSCVTHRKRCQRTAFSASISTLALCPLPLYDDSWSFR